MVLNAGSSSVKACLFEVQRVEGETELRALWKAQVDLTEKNCELSYESVGKSQLEPVAAEFPFLNLESLYDKLFEALLADPGSPVADLSDILAIGHRIVHGGQNYFEATEITPKVMRDLEELVDLAPSHMPASLKGIQTACRYFPKSVQVGVFDTGFHRTMPDEARIYSAPWEWYEQLHIRRYGFHGISHSYSMHAAAKLLGHSPHEIRMISCHLGGGDSLCAIKFGQSVMNTMGFTPLDGMVMGTRCGAIDPGIILYLMRHHNFTGEDLDKSLNNDSGLKGISGISSNMLEIKRAADSGHERAKLAIEIYLRSLTANVSALVPLLGKLDVLSFTGGIGENSSFIRKAAVERLGFLGIEIDDEKNEAPQDEDSNISKAGALAKTVVIHAKEQLQIGRQCLPFVYKTAPLLLINKPPAGYNRVS